MRSRDAWLTLFAAALGVDAASCRKQATPTSDDASSTEVVAVTAAMPSTEPVDASVAVDASVLTDAADAAKPVASKQPMDETQRSLLALLSSDAGDVLGGELVAGDSGLLIGLGNSCGATMNRPRLNQACGASAIAPQGGLSNIPVADTTVSIVSGEKANDQRTLASMRPSIRGCFARELSVNPTTPDGRVTFTLAILANGDVASVTMGSSTLPTDDTSCISRRLQAASFAAPGSNRTLVINVVQKKTP